MARTSAPRAASYGSAGVLTPGGEATAGAEGTEFAPAGARRAATATGRGARGASAPALRGGPRPGVGGRVELGVQTGHPVHRLLVIAADDDPVGVEAVGHGAAFPQELGVGDDEDVASTERQGHLHGGTDGHRRLVDHHGPRLEDGADLL